MSEERTSRVGTGMFLGSSSLAARAIGQCVPGIKTLTLVVVLMAAPVVLADRPDGLDVSYWQGNITQSEWDQAAGAGNVFGFCRASAGVSYADSTLDNNMSRATEASLIMGVYHFSYPNDYSATAEADWFVSVAGSYLTSGYLRPVLDLEKGNNLGATALSNWVNDWMDRVELLTGVQPLIYTNTNYATNYLNFTVAHRDLWIAQWYPFDPETDEPDIGVFNTWAFWQWTDSCPIPGIGETVDCDVFNGTMAGLQSFVIGGGSQPPTITQHPSDQEVLEGSMAVFTVQATGSTPLSYRWQKNGVDLNNGGHYSGVTTKTLIVSMVDSGDEADYRCRVTNDYGNATSNTAALMVLLLGDECVQNAGFENGFISGVGKGWIKFNMVGDVVCASSSDSYSGVYSQRVTCDGDEDGGMYQQFYVTPGNSYTVSVWIKCISAGGIQGILGVDPYGGTDPNSGDIWWGTKPYDYYSQKTWNGTAFGVSGKITVFLRAQETRPAETGDVFFDEVAPACDSAPVITEPPSSLNVCAGDAATFSVAAIGAGTLTYQWQKDLVDLNDGGNISGVTTHTLQVLNVQTADEGNYRCVVSNSYGSANSDEAVLTLRTSVAPDMDADCDVDLDDFGHFQACLTGPALGPPASGCEDADFDGDGDVDLSDFGGLQRCFSGPNVPADPSCAD